MQYALIENFEVLEVLSLILEVIVFQIQSVEFHGIVNSDECVSHVDDETEASRWIIVFLHWPRVDNVSEWLR